MGAFAVFHFLDGVIVTEVDDFLLLDHCAVHGIYQSPANAAAASRVNESVLGACVEGIFAVHKLRVQDHVSLLAAGLNIRKPLPVHKVLRAGNACSGRCGGKVSLQGVVLALHAEDAVDPAVLMGREAHVVDVGCGLSPFRHGDGTGPELEIVHSVGAFGYGEETLTVIAFHAHYKHVFAVPLDGAGIKGCIHPNPFHKEGVTLTVEVITPLKRGMSRRKDGVFPTLIDTVALDGAVLLFNQCAMVVLKPRKSLVKGHSSTIFSFSVKVLKSSAPSNPAQGA